MTTKAERAENKAIQAQAKELRELLGEFGARLGDHRYECPEPLILFQRQGVTICRG